MLTTPLRLWERTDSVLLRADWVPQWAAMQEQGHWRSLGAQAFNPPQK